MSSCQDADATNQVVAMDTDDSCERYCVPVTQVIVSPELRSYLKSKFEDMAIYYERKGWSYSHRALCVHIIQTGVVDKNGTKNYYPPRFEVQLCKKSEINKDFTISIGRALVEILVPKHVVTDNDKICLSVDEDEKIFFVSGGDISKW